MADTAATPTVMMVVRNLKSDLPDEELLRRARDRMPAFREVPGLIQKYYARDTPSGPSAWAGVYLWDCEASMQAFLESDLRKTIPSAYELNTPPQVEVFPLVDVLRAD